MEKDEVKVDSDWLSSIDGETATDADRWKAILDLMGESMERERREKWQAEHEANGGGWRLGEGGGESRPFALQWGGYPKGGYTNGDSREEAVGSNPVREQFAHALRRAGRPNLRVHQGVRLHEPHPHRRGGDDHRGAREGQGRDEARDGVRPVHRAKGPHEGPEEGLRHRRQQDGIERRMGRGEAPPRARGAQGARLRFVADGVLGGGDERPPRPRRGSRRARWGRRRAGAGGRGSLQARRRVDPWGSQAHVRRQHGPEGRREADGGGRAQTSCSRTRRTTSTSRAPTGRRSRTTA